MLILASHLEPGDNFADEAGTWKVVGARRRGAARNR
jgi:hypothetical protein